MPIDITCFACSKVVSRRAIKEALETKKNFCSKECKNNYYYVKNTVKGDCTNCGKYIERNLTESKKNKNKNLFCNYSCAATYHNSHKTKGSSISKMEKYIQVILKIIFPDIEFLFNDTTAIKAELDIFLPKYNLAFELNGIFHYEPIFGKDHLDRTVSNDNRKYQACLENNIELVILDTSSVKYFKIEKCEKFLNIIIDIIRTKTNYAITYDLSKLSKQEIFNRMSLIPSFKKVLGIIDCKYCGNKMNQRNSKTIFCSRKCFYSNKNNKPSKDTLEEDNKTLKYYEIAKKYNVCNYTVYRWLNSYNIQPKQ